MEGVCVGDRWTVASAQTNTAMETLEKNQVTQGHSDKGSKIPVKSRLPRAKAVTNNTGSNSNATAQTELLQRGGKSVARQDQEKPSGRVISRSRPTSAVNRKESDESKGKGGHTESSVKENVAPSSGSSSGQRQVSTTATPGFKKSTTKR